MPANANWPKWVYASLATALGDAADGVQLPKLVETLDDRTDAFMSADERCEIRITGPFIREVMKGDWMVDVFANVLLTVRLKGTTTLPYRIQELAGIFQQVMAGPIGVFRYGSGDDDDQEQIACLFPAPKKEAVKVFHFGQVHETDRVLQAAVDAHFYCNLSS